MSLVAYYCIWNEAESIAHSLRSVKAYVDRFVVLDVAFSSNPVAATHSTDGTRAIVEAVCDPVPLHYIESDRKMSEHEARSLLMESVANGEWMLGLDGDEILFSDHSEFLALRDSLGERPDDVLQVRVYSTAVMADGMADSVTRVDFQTLPLISHRGWAPRLIRKRPGLHCRRMGAAGRYTYGGIWLNEEYVGNLGPRINEAFIINDHAGQSFERYQFDYRWESAQRVRPL